MEKKKRYRHLPPHEGMRPLPPSYPVGHFGGPPFFGPMVPGPFAHPVVAPHFMSPVVPPMMPPPGLYHPLHEPPWVRQLDQSIHLVCSVCVCSVCL